MKTFLAFYFCLSAFLSFGQILDSAALRQVDSLVATSRQLTGERRFDEATQAGELAQKIAEEAFGKQSAPYAKCLFNLGRVLHLSGRYKQAEPFYLEAKVIRGNVLGINNYDYAASLNNLGLVYEQLGRYPEAEQMHLEAINIRGNILGKEHPEYAMSLNNLAIVYFDMGRYDSAEQLYLEARDTREKALGKAHPDYAQSLHNLANLYTYMGRYEAAEPLYLEALGIWDKAHPSYAYTLLNLANLYNKMGRYESAELFYLEALTILGNLLGKEHLEYARTLNGLAFLYTITGRYESAEKLFLEAKAILEKISGKEQLEYARTLNGLALLYTNTGRFEPAENIYLEANTMLEQVFGKENRDYADNLNNLANLYNDMRRYDDAEKLYREAIAVWGRILGKTHPEYAKRLINLANLYLNMGRYEDAEPYYLEAKNIQEKVLGKNHPDHAVCLVNLALLRQQMGRYESAGALFQEAQAIHNVLLSNSSRFLSSRELSAYGQIFTNRLDFYYSFAICTYGAPSGFTAGCYNNALFYKGFLLNVSSRISRLAASDTAATRLTNLLKSYHRLLAGEYAKPLVERKGVAALEEKANATEKVLAYTVAGFGEAVREVRWQEVQAALKPGEAAVEFIHFRYYNFGFADSVLYAALVLRPGDSNPHLVPLFEARQLASLLPQGNDPDMIDDFYHGKNGSVAYALIWQPLEKLLKGTTNVYCSPSGLLHRINLGALPQLAGLTFADRFHLVLLGSTRQLVNQNAGMLTRSEAVLFGGIQYDADTMAVDTQSIKQDITSRYALMATGITGFPFPFDTTTRSSSAKAWKALPATASEVKNIAALFQKEGFNAQLETGSAATEEAFKELGRSGPSPRILHLATHGYFFPDPKASMPSPGSAEPGASGFKISDDPMIRSGLILAGANRTWTTGQSPAKGEDGILTAYEISQQNLSNTELVVLSACETGLGQIEGNEGVYGLQRAFKIAGAKYLVMSLWQVSDQKTSELMVEFYRLYLDRKLPIPEAFRVAQQAMRVKYPGSPYVWAGFILVQ